LSPDLRRLAVALFTIDLLVLLAYLTDVLLGHPVGVLSTFVDLDREQNLPTWWSSAKLFLIALVFGTTFVLRYRSDGPRAWLLAAAALLAAGLSLDETGLLHERLGTVILPHGQREGTMFEQGGPWVMVLVPGALVATVGLWQFGLGRYLRAAPGAATLLLAGFGLLVAGAAGVELLRVQSVGSWWHPAQVLVEEGLEFVGATLALLGAVSVARALGVRVVAGP
jgi:hypothetical protein